MYCLYKLCINLPFGDCAMYFDHAPIEVASPFVHPQLRVLHTQQPTNHPLKMLVGSDDPFRNWNGPFFAGDM